MSEGPSLLGLGELTKPATILIEKISDAVGGIFKPFQLVRVAKAEAEATRLHAEAQIQITDLQRRAMHRFLAEEATKQSNIEAIAGGALPLLAESSAPQDIGNDWIANFFDKSRIVSDKDVQNLWARVLAREANAPGAFARKTVNVLADLDKSDAEVFSQLCGFCWNVEGTVTPLVLDSSATIYVDRGITFGALSHLQSLGLIHFDAMAGFTLKIQVQPAIATYAGRHLPLAPALGVLDVGTVIFTRAGTELATVCTPEVIPGFFEHVSDQWARHSTLQQGDQSTTAKDAEP